MAPKGAFAATMEIAKMSKTIAAMFVQLVKCHTKMKGKELVATQPTTF